MGAEHHRVWDRYGHEWLIPIASISGTRDARRAVEQVTGGPACYVVARPPRAAK